jgi:hypothetical protein
MARALTAVGIALVLLVGGLVLAVQLGRDESRVAVDNLLAEDLSRAVALAEQETDGTVDLRELAPFAWDRLLVVARGTPDAAIDARLGGGWSADTGVAGGELLVLLDDEGSVVRFFDYRGEGRFEGFEVPFDERPRERAVLAVRNLTITPKG